MAVACECFRLTTVSRETLRVAIFYSVEVESDTVDFELDSVKLAQPIADAMRDAIADGIRAITETSRDGKHKLFNRTGALVEGLRVERDGDAFVILPPSDHFTGPNAAALLTKLVDLVPAIADPLSSQRVKDELAKVETAKVGACVTERIG